MLRDLQNLIQKGKRALNGTMPTIMPNALQMDFCRSAYETKVFPIIDLADMHVTDEAARAISTYQLNGGVMFIDSKSPGRQAVLDANIEYAHSDKPEPTPLPEFGIDTTIKDYITSLDPTKHYTVAGYSPNHTFALALYILLTRRKINILVSNKSGYEFLKWVHRYLPFQDFIGYPSFIGIDSHAGQANIVLDYLTYDLETETVKTREGYHITYQNAWAQYQLVPDIFSEPQAVIKYKAQLSELMEASKQLLQEYMLTCPQKLDKLIQEVYNV